MPHFDGLASSSFPSSPPSTDELREKNGRRFSEGSGVWGVPCWVSSAAIVQRREATPSRGMQQGDSHLWDISESQEQEIVIQSLERQDAEILLHAR
jgi:hypothetical protein